jgi:hypothetical protein
MEKPEKFQRMMNRAGYAVDQARHAWMNKWQSVRVVRSDLSSTKNFRAPRSTLSRRLHVTACQTGVCSLIEERGIPDRYVPLYPEGASYHF